MQPRRHRMRKPARLDSARAWIRSGARVTVGAHAKHYGVDRNTAYEDLTAIGARCLPAWSNGRSDRPRCRANVVAPPVRCSGF